MLTETTDKYLMDLKSPRSGISTLKNITQTFSNDGCFFFIFQQFTDDKIGVRVKAIKPIPEKLKNCHGQVLVKIDGKVCHFEPFQLKDGREDIIFTLPPQLLKTSTNPERYSYHVDLNTQREEEEIMLQIQKSLQEVLRNPEYQLTLKHFGTVISNDGRVLFRLNDLGKNDLGQNKLKILLKIADSEFPDKNLLNCFVTFLIINHDQEKIFSLMFRTVAGQAEQVITLPKVFSITNKSEGRFMLGDCHYQTRIHRFNAF